MKNQLLNTWPFLLVIILLAASMPASKAQNTQNKALVLTGDQLAQFEKLTLKKVNDFQKYLGKMASKDYTNADKIVFKESALNNFINLGKGVYIEISSMTGGQEKRTRKLLPIYLDNLSRLPWARVELKAAKACYVSNLLQDGTDANGNPIYRGTATYYQEFVGYSREGNAVYRDITQKTIEVELRFTTDLDRPRWIVSLGDINVAETSQ